MRTDVDSGQHAEYRWTRDSTDHWLRVTALGDAAIPTAGSLDEFITDHQWGYSVKGGGECYEYRVERPPWRVFPVASYDFRVDAEGVRGGAPREAGLGDSGGRLGDSGELRGKGHGPQFIGLIARFASAT